MAGLDDESLSPKDRLKFLCSYGGKILPRPSDGHLRYVGGDTRVLAVPRSIAFSEFKEKIDGMFKAEVVVKYQVMPEDLDVIVSVRSDEDLHHMLDEYDRHDRPRSPTSSGSPRFRLFLFSPFAAPQSSSSPHEGATTLDAVNGGAAASTTIRRPIFALSYSARTSPTSTIDSAAMMSHEGLILGGRPIGHVRHRDGGGMHRVRSTPNLSGSQYRHPQQKYSAVYGAHAGGTWRAGGAQLIGGVRYEGCHQPVRGCYYSPAAAGPTMCCGHVNEAGAQASGLSAHFAAAAGVPPRTAE